MYWFNERVHLTWHVTAIMFGFVFGVFLALFIHLPSLFLFILSILLLIWVFIKQNKYLVLIAFVVGGLLGLIRGDILQSDLQKVHSYYGQQVYIRGKVADDIDFKSRGAHINLANIELNGHAIKGNFFVTATGAEKAKRSDNLVVKGVLTTGFGGFVATTSGSVLSIERPTPGDIPLAVRDSFADNIKKSISEPEASLGVGYLLGQKNALPSDLVEALKITGLTHAVVASGYNLTILVRLSRRIFEKISKYLSMLTSAGMILVFIGMTGLSPSMTRAGLVTGLSLWAWYYGRKFHPVTLLGLTMAITVAIKPSYIWGDVGWLLSFGAFAGVMIIAPIITAYFFGKQKIPFVAQILIETTSAQIATLPILIAIFSQVSLIAPIVNLLILPIIPIIMFLVTLAGFSALILPSITLIIAWPAQQLLNIQVWIINWFAELPWAMIETTATTLSVTLYVVLLCMVIWYMKYKSKYNLYRASLVE